MLYSFKFDETMTQAKNNMKATLNIDQRHVTRIFLGQGSFVGELGHFNKQHNFPTAQERENPQEKNLSFFCQETLKNFILNEEFYP